MSWYYQMTGNIFEATGAEATALNALILAQKHDPIPGQSLWGPYATRAGAEAAKVAHPPIAKQFEAIKESIVPSTQTIVAAVENWVVRFAEVAVGIVLLAVAAHAIITSGSAGNSAASLAKVVTTAVKVAK